MNNLKRTIRASGIWDTLKDLVHQITLIFYRTKWERRSKDEIRKKIIELKDKSSHRDLVKLDYLERYVDDIAPHTLVCF